MSIISQLKQQPTAPKYHPKQSGNYNQPIPQTPIGHNPFAPTSSRAQTRRTPSSRAQTRDPVTNRTTPSAINTPTTDRRKRRSCLRSGGPASGPQTRPPRIISRVATYEVNRVKQVVFFIGNDSKWSATVGIHTVSLKFCILTRKIGHDCHVKLNT